ncbi:MAG: DNA-protecting protein DprA [Chitinophagaceae bacterium]|nr:DNA-protecting protein DprA [Chitinophagaceae bacterium]
MNTKDILTINSIGGVGRKTLSEFINYVETKISVFDLHHSTIEGIFKELNVQNKKIKVPLKKDIDSAIEKTDLILTSSDKNQIHIVSIKDLRYPSQLRDIEDYPFLLYYKGNLECLSKPSAAVIGTRDPSSFGKQAGERIGYRLAEQNITVVSGLAKGCDTSGHIGCLKANGKTVAVLAHGLDTVYPAENRGLAAKILENDGCLVSEYAINTKVLSSYFIARDRIQAGLSKAVIVIETDIKGGTMHTVNYSITYNRYLAAVNHPSPYENDKSRGNKMLILEKNAQALNTKDDIDILIEKINPSIKRTLFPTNIPINEIYIPLFEGIDFNPTIKKKSGKKPRYKKSKPNTTQLPIDKDIIPLKTKKTRKKKEEIDTEKPDNNEPNI